MAPGRLAEFVETISAGVDLVVRVTRFDMVGLGGVEPPTSPLSGVRSNQLSYRPGGQASGGPASESRGLTN